MIKSWKQLFFCNPELNTKGEIIFLLVDASDLRTLNGGLLLLLKRVQVTLRVPGWQQSWLRTPRSQDTAAAWRTSLGNQTAVVRWILQLHRGAGVLQEYWRERERATGGDWSLQGTPVWTWQLGWYFTPVLKGQRCVCVCVYMCNMTLILLPGDAMSLSPPSNTTCYHTWGHRSLGCHSNLYLTCMFRVLDWNVWKSHMNHSLKPYKLFLISDIEAAFTQRDNSTYQHTRFYRDQKSRLNITTQSVHWDVCVPTVKRSMSHPKSHMHRTWNNNKNTNFQGNTKSLE